MNQKLTDTKIMKNSYTHKKMKLQEYFGERIVQSEINGKPNVATFRTTARVVLQDYYSKQQQQQQQQQKKNTTEKIKPVQAYKQL